MRMPEARSSIVAGCAATCAVLAFTSVGVHPAEQAAQQPRIGHTTVQLLSATVGSPEEILTSLVNATAATVGAVAWFAAFPITIPASVALAYVIDAFTHPGTTTIRPDQALAIGLQLFVSLPTQAVQNAFTELGQSLGLITPPAVAAHASTGAARTALVRPARRADTARSNRKPAAAAAHSSIKNTKHSAAQGRHATPR